MPFVELLKLNYYLVRLVLVLFTNDLFRLTFQRLDFFFFFIERRYLE